MTQKLIFKVIENDIIRDATFGEMIAWKLLQFTNACNAGNCNECPLLVIGNDIGCWNNFYDAKQVLKDKEIKIEVSEK